MPPQPGARAPLMFAANGVRPAQNNYLLDGIDNNTSNVDFLSGVAYIVKPPIDAVDEIKVMTSAFSAEYGRAGGAVLNTTLKSGINQLRGTVWEFYRNDAMNANDFFANRAGIKKGEYLSNQFGFTGRRARSSPTKTFWFADYEGSLIKQARTWVTTRADCGSSAPAASRTISDLIALQTGTVGADVLGRTFPRGTVFDPATTRPLTAGQVDPVTGMVATHDGLRARSISPATPFRRAGSTRTRSSCINLYPAAEPGRVEQQLHRQPAQQRRHARVRHSRRSQLQRQRSVLRPLQLLQQPQDPAFTVRRRWRRRRVLRRRRESARHGFAASHTHMFSSTLINEARFGLSREHTYRLQPNGDDTQQSAGDSTASRACRR